MQQRSMKEMEKTAKTILENLKNSFNLIDYSNGTYMLNTPLFHRINGTPYSIFVNIDGSTITISDHGQTIERLLEQKDITEEYIAHKLSTISSKYGCRINNSNEIEIEADIEHFNMYFNMFVHTVIAIDNIMEI